MVLLLHIYCLRLVLRLSDGNGFKTSSMRLGADVIVFSRHLNDRFDSDVLVLLPRMYIRIYLFIYFYINLGCLCLNRPCISVDFTAN